MISSYLIKKGSNAPTPNSQKVVLFKKATEFAFRFKFKSNCLYSFGDPRYDGDLNKLGGVSTNLSLIQNGARIGWNCGSKTMSELRADPWITLRGYVEKNNKRVPTSNTMADRLCRVRPEFWYDAYGEFRPMTDEERNYYRSIAGASEYTYVVDIEVNFDEYDSFDDHQIPPGKSYNDYIKGNRMITMPCPTPSSVGYYYFFPWFGGDAPGGSPHDINIEMAHDYNDTLLNRIAVSLYSKTLKVSSFVNRLFTPTVMTA